MADPAEQSMQRGSDAAAQEHTLQKPSIALVEDVTSETGAAGAVEKQKQQFPSKKEFKEEFHDFLGQKNRVYAKPKKTTGPWIRINGRSYDAETGVVHGSVGVGRDVEYKSVEMAYDDLAVMLDENLREEAIKEIVQKSVAVASEREKLAAQEDDASDSSPEKREPVKSNNNNGKDEVGDHKAMSKKFSKEDHVKKTLSRLGASELNDFMRGFIGRNIIFEGDYCRVQFVYNNRQIKALLSYEDPQRDRLVPYKVFKQTILDAEKNEREKDAIDEKFEKALDDELDKIVDSSQESVVQQDAVPRKTAETKKDSGEVGHITAIELLRGENIELFDKIEDHALKYLHRVEVVLRGKDVFQQTRKMVLRSLCEGFVQDIFKGRSFADFLQILDGDDQKQLKAELADSLYEKLLVQVDASRELEKRNRKVSHRQKK